MLAVVLVMLDDYPSQITLVVGYTTVGSGSTLVGKPARSGRCFASRFKFYEISSPDVS
jgi:hypothetical protein